MTTRSRIEWTESTWNPVVGCTKVSAGCKHCYAEMMSRRLQAMGVEGYEGGFRSVKVLTSRLEEPLLRTRPTVYFVNSMSDLFHTRVPDSFLDDVFEVMRRCPQHTFQVLTKRAERLLGYTSERSVPSNVWLGVSVENRRHGVPRIGYLRQVQARTRFVSVEPLLEDLGRVDFTGVSWAIVGGESGPGARRMKTEWVQNIQRQCMEQGVRFFFKQWGAYGADGVRRSKKANGRIFEGRLWNDMPAFA